MFHAFFIFSFADLVAVYDYLVRAFDAEEVELNDEEPIINVEQLPSVCAICMLQEPSFVFPDCGHVCVCDVCIQPYRNHDASEFYRKCPVCVEAVVNLPFRIIYV